MNELTDEEIDEVREKVVEMFGENNVRYIDRRWMDLHQLRIASSNNYDFLLKVRQDHIRDGGDGDLLVAAVLYGIRLGEIGREWAYEQQRMSAGTDPQYQ